MKKLSLLIVAQIVALLVAVFVICPAFAPFLIAGLFGAAIGVQVALLGGVPLTIFATTHTLKKQAEADARKAKSDADVARLADLFENISFAGRSPLAGRSRFRY